MSERIRQIVKHGTWLYGDSLSYDVWILKQNYVDDPGANEKERALTLFNEGGYLFYAAYGRNQRWTGISKHFGTKAEAIAEAERTIQGGINWD